MTTQSLTPISLYDAIVRDALTVTVTRGALGSVDPRHEEWRRIPEFPRYEVSNLGRVRSVDRIDRLGQHCKGRVLKQQLSGPRRNYLTVMLSYGRSVQKRFSVHSLLLTTFVRAPCAGEECRHLDGNSLNNVLPNLRWGTAKENYEDRVTHGTDYFTRKEEKNARQHR